MAIYDKTRIKEQLKEDEGFRHRAYCQGDRNRREGMKKLWLVLLAVFMLGCTTIRVDAPKAGTVSIGADKNLTGSVSPSGNTVPIGK